ncbi:hypothetical protein B0H19DRAFT_1248243 [Mycena capillaripes]|nr:hypothetical protein B0H19DRAFT_1248243 [Mycena capillaripes]
MALTFWHDHPGVHHHISILHTGLPLPNYQRDTALASQCRAIQWVCRVYLIDIPDCIRCNPHPRHSSEQAAMEAERATWQKIKEAYIIPKAWDSSHAFWAKSTMSSPDLISTAPTRMDDTPLSEVQKVWRILGRPNVATEDAEGNYEENFSDRRKTAL